MKTLLNPWFVAACLVWLLVFITRQISLPLPYLNGYLTDALAVPVVATLGLWFLRQWIIRNNYYVLSPRQVIFVVLAIAVWFEVALPRYSTAYTADVVDILLYTAGGIFFYLVMNKPMA